MDNNLLQNIAIELKAHAAFSERGESVNTEYALEAAKAISDLIEKTGYRVVKDEDRPVEVWHKDRKVTVYGDIIIRTWGSTFDEMSDEPRTHESVGAAFDWLYGVGGKSE